MSIEKSGGVNYPDRKLTFEFKGNKYAIEFPNTGDLLEIMILKSRLSRGQYDNISASFKMDSKLAQTIIEAVSFLNVACPDLEKSLNVDSLLDLNMIDMRELLEVYLKEISPWYVNWITALNKPIANEGSDE